MRNSCLAGWSSLTRTAAHERSRRGECAAATAAAAAAATADGDWKFVTQARMHLLGYLIETTGVYAGLGHLIVILLLRILRRRRLQPQGKRCGARRQCGRGEGQAALEQRILCAWNFRCCWEVAYKTVKIKDRLYDIIE